MARAPKQNKSSNKPGGSRYAALAIFAVLCLIVGAYLFFSPATPVAPPVVPAIPTSAPPVKHPQQRTPSIQIPSPDVLPIPDKKTPDVIPPREVKKLPVAQVHGTALLAIIVDDMGTTLREARLLAGIGVPLTFSIIPGLSHFREVAEFATSSGIETMIHIPMQSQGWPERRLEANGLLVSMADTDIADRMEGFVRSLPKATGANNHTGSEFTEHEDKMRAVLGVLKGRGLFFVDSVTTPKTVGETLAKQLGMKTGRRQVFLDNEQNEVYILGQLNQAVRLAKRTGTAIVICHPHPATIKTLVAALPGLEKQGVMLVPASRLVK